jgi:hypothetical protein
MKNKKNKKNKKNILKIENPCNQDLSIMPVSENGQCHLRPLFLQGYFQPLFYLLQPAVIRLNNKSPRLRCNRRNQQETLQKKHWLRIH